MNRAFVALIALALQPFSSPFCLQPDIPDNGHVTFPQSPPYETGVRARYSCDLGFIHLGVEERICTNDGAWSHQTPICAVNVALHKPSFQSSVVTNNHVLHANLSTDGVLEGDCAHTLVEAKPWWRVDLLEDYKIYAVEVLLGDSNALSWLEVSVVTTSGQSNAALCTKRRGNLEPNQLHTFICDQELEGRYVTVSSSQGALQLCEVFVLSVRYPSLWQCENAAHKQLMGVHGGYCYARSVDQKLPWFDAQNDCLKQGASLPLHLDREQQTYLASQLSNRLDGDAQFYWLGLMAAQTPQIWKWVDGVPLNNSVAGWADPQAQMAPPNRQGTHFAAGMARAFVWKWMPISQTIYNSWICQSKPRFCASPGVPAAGGVMVSSQTYAVGGSAFYYCTHGFELAGVESRRCEENGVWSDNVPTCNIVSCPLPNPLPLGEVRLLNGTTTYGSLVEYRCREGYHLSVTQSYRICQADATWSGSVPHCREVHCKTPKKIENGTVIVNGTGFGSVAKYICSPTHRMVGVSQLKCSNLGQWLPEAPTCYDLTSFRELFAQKTDAAEVPVLRTQMNWLIVFVCAVFIFLVLLFIALVMVWRRRNQPDTFSLSTLYGSRARSDLACSNVSVVGDKNKLLYGFTGVSSSPTSTPSSGTPGNYSSPYPVEQEATYVTSNSAQQRLEQHNQGLYYATANVASPECGITELELPPHLLKLEQLPNGNIHLTLPCRPRAHVRPALPALQTTPISTQQSEPNTSSLPRLPQKRVRKKFQRPKKFQTMVATVRKKISSATAPSDPRVAPSEPQRRLSAADIVVIGLQRRSSDPELRQRSDSPTPSELLYSFNDADLSDSSDVQNAPPSTTGDSRVYFEFDIESSKGVAHHEPIYDFPPDLLKRAAAQQRPNADNRERSTSVASEDSNVYEELKSESSATALEHSGFELVHTIC